MMNVIKEYLVSLGMSVDKNSFNEVTKQMQTLENGIKKFAGSVALEFSLAGGAIITALASATAAITGLLGGLAKADLEMDMFARRMWLSKENAAELNNTLKAMGATVEDLYLSPELLRNFQELRSTIRDMKPPPEFQNQMKFIRSIRLEFQRMRLEATYSLQWIGFYLFKYLEGPLHNIRQALSGFNDRLIKTMPEWTKTIAQGISWIARLVIALARAGSDIFHIFSKISEHIPKSIKAIGAALVALALIIQTGPFGILFTTFTAILLLLDDFYTYLDGGESAFAPLWKKLQEFYKTLKDTGVIERLGRAFDNAFKYIESGINQSWNALERLYQKMQESGYLDAYKKTWISTFNLLKIVIEGLWEKVTSFFDDLNSSGTLSGLIDSIINLGTEVSKTTGWVSDLVAKFLQIKEVQTVLEGIGNFISGTLNVLLDGIRFTLDNITNSLKIARTYMSGNDEEYQQALKERQEMIKKQDERGSYYGDKIRQGFDFLFMDETAPNPFLSNNTNNTSNKVEPSFKKALNDSDVAKGIKSFKQDLNSGFNLLAAAINPDVFQNFQAMTAGGVPSSYMYNTNSSSSNTIINNDNRPIFNITSTDPKGAAQEVSQQWSGMNLRSMRGAIG